MKKLIASLLVLVFGATMVMAEGTMGSLVQSAELAAFENVMAAEIPVVGTDSFASVEGLMLTESDATKVRGEGIGTVIVIAAILFFASAAKAY